MTEESKDLSKGSAARLLSDWRAAERDAVAAHDTASVAAVAVEAARTAARAAIETAEAAKLALEAATKAERSARETAEAAQILAASTLDDQAVADAEVGRADAAETTARDAFRVAQDAGFPKEPPGTPDTGR